MGIFTILNFGFFQMLWFSCVLGAGGYGLHWLALGALIPISVLTWFSASRSADVTVAIVALSLGLIIDNLWINLGILSYPQSTFAPYWIALLWIGLGLTVNHSMSWFRDRPLVGSLIVGAFAPVTYLTGQRFGAVVVEDLYLTAAISLSWFLLFYGLARFSLWMLNADETQLASTKGDIA